MGRKIILLSDGTGNSSAKVWRTNVWRTFEALDLSGNDQVALYDDGVGTSSFKPMAILGGAFGLQRSTHAGFRLVDGMAEGSIALLVSCASAQSTAVRAVLDAHHATDVVVIG